jgi:hypothetical protein
MAYPVHRGWGGTCPHAAHDGRDRTPHVDEDPFSQAAMRCFALKLHVLSVYFMCFKCFKRYIASVLIDVVKVNRDVTHVAMVFSSVCPKCFICFRHVLQVFHLDVVKIDLDVAYTCMLQAYVLSVSGVSYVYCKCLI